jgi:hypothetical protein
MILAKSLSFILGAATPYIAIIRTRDSERETEDNEGDHVKIMNIVHDII